MWVQHMTDGPRLHPKLDRIWQGPADILCKGSENTYLVNLNGKEVILSLERRKPSSTPTGWCQLPLPSLPRASGPPEQMFFFFRMFLTMSIALIFERSQRGPRSPSKAAKPGGGSNTRVFPHEINDDRLDYNQLHHITVSTDSL